MEKLSSLKILEEMNYFMDLKLSGGKSPDTYVNIYKSLSDLEGNKIRKGLATEEEIETFRSFLPSTEQIFNDPTLHSSMAVLPTYFDEVVRENKITNEMTEGKVMAA